MPNISVKFFVGDMVSHFTGQRGMVTAVFLRGKNTSYELSYMEGETPTSCNVEECELQLDNVQPIGFRVKEIERESE